METVKPETGQNDGKDVSVSMGVGDGSGNLFIHGSYEAIDQVRQILIALRTNMNRERRLKERIRQLEESESALHEILRDASKKFARMEREKAEDHQVIARLIILVETEFGRTQAELVAQARARLTVST